MIEYSQSLSFYYFSVLGLTAAESRIYRWGVPIPHGVILAYWGQKEFSANYFFFSTMDHGVKMGNVEFVDAGGKWTNGWPRIPPAYTERM
jgi:hypothetical protein